MPPPPPPPPPPLPPLQRKKGRKNELHFLLTHPPSSRRAWRRPRPNHKRAGGVDGDLEGKLPFPSILQVVPRRDREGVWGGAASILFFLGENLLAALLCPSVRAPKCEAALAKGEIFSP